MKVLALLIARLIVAAIGGAVFMLALGTIHDEILRAVQPAGFWTSTLVLLLLKFAWTVTTETE